MEENTADHFNTRKFLPAKNRSVIWGNIIIPKVITIQRESQSCMVHTPCGPGRVNSAGHSAYAAANASATEGKFFKTTHKEPNTRPTHMNTPCAASVIATPFIPPIHTRMIITTMNTLAPTV